MIVLLDPWDTPIVQVKALQGVAVGAGVADVVDVSATIVAVAPKSIAIAATKEFLRMVSRPALIPQRVRETHQPSRHGAVYWGKTSGSFLR